MHFSCARLMESKTLKKVQILVFFIDLFVLFRVDLNSVLDLNLYNEHGNSR